MATEFTKKEASDLIGKKVRQPIDNSTGKIIGTICSDQDAVWKVLILWDGSSHDISYNKARFTELYLA